MRMIFATLMMAKIRKKRDQRRLEKAVTDAKYRKELNHKNLLRVVQVAKDEPGRLVKVFYRLPMNNLCKLKELLPLQTVFKLFFDINEAIVTLRKRKIYHGDIRPELICFDVTDNAFVLLDRPFGNQDSVELQKKKVASNEKLFMSPQLFDNIVHDGTRRVNSLKSEIFSLGMVILDIFFGDWIQDWYFRGPEPGYEETAFREFLQNWKDKAKMKIKEFQRNNNIENSEKDFYGMRERWIALLMSESSSNKYKFYKFFLFLIRRVLVFNEKSRDFPTKVFSKVQEVFSREHTQEIMDVDTSFILGTSIINIDELFDYFKIQVPGPLSETKNEELEEKKINADPELPQSEELKVSALLRKKRESEMIENEPEPCMTPKKMDFEAFLKAESHEKKMMEQVNFGEKDNLEIEEIIEENNKQLKKELFGKQSDSQENEGLIVQTENEEEKDISQNIEVEEIVLKNDQELEIEEIPIENSKSESEINDILEDEKTMEDKKEKENPIESNKNDVKEKKLEPEEKGEEPKEIKEEKQPTESEVKQKEETKDIQESEEIILDQTNDSEVTPSGPESNEVTSQIISQDSSQIKTMSGFHTNSSQVNFKSRKSDVSATSKISMKFKDMIDLHMSKRDSDISIPSDPTKIHFSKQLDPALVTKSFKKFKFYNNFITEEPQKIDDNSKVSGIW